MVNAETPSQKGPEGIEPIKVVNDVQLELKALEGYYPSLTANPEYSRLREELTLTETDGAKLDFEIIGALYSRLVTLLRTIKLDDNVVVLGKPRIRHKPPLEVFLPGSFAEFIESISKVNQTADYYDDAVEAAAHALMLGEITHGLNEVIPHFRDIVKARVMDELSALSTGGVLVELEERDLFEMMQLSEEDLVNEHMEADNFAVALSVLAVRKELNANYKLGAKLSKAGKVDRPAQTTTAEVEALSLSSPGLFRLLRAVALSEIESPQEARKRLASRITRVIRVVD